MSFLHLFLKDKSLSAFCHGSCFLSFYYFLCPLEFEGFFQFVCIFCIMRCPELKLLLCQVEQNNYCSAACGMSILLIPGLFGFSESIIFQFFSLCYGIPHQLLLCSTGAYPIISYTVLMSENRS